MNKRLSKRIDRRGFMRLTALATVGAAAACAPQVDTTDQPASTKESTREATEITQPPEVSLLTNIVLWDAGIGEPQPDTGFEALSPAQEGDGKAPSKIPAAMPDAQLIDLDQPSDLSNALIQVAEAQGLDLKSLSAMLICRSGSNIGSPVLYAKDESGKATTLYWAEKEGVLAPFPMTLSQTLNNGVIQWNLLSGYNLVAVKALPGTEISPRIDDPGEGMLPVVKIKNEDGEWHLWAQRVENGTSVWLLGDELTEESNRWMVSEGQVYHVEEVAIMTTKTNEVKVVEWDTNMGQVAEVKEVNGDKSDTVRTFAYDKDGKELAEWKDGEWEKVVEVDVVAELKKHNLYFGGGWEYETRDGSIYEKKGNNYETEVLRIDSEGQWVPVSLEERFSGLKFELNAMEDFLVRNEFYRKPTGPSLRNNRIYGGVEQQYRSGGVLLGHTALVQTSKNSGSFQLVPYNDGMEINMDDKFTWVVLDALMNINGKLELVWLLNPLTLDDRVYSNNHPGKVCPLTTGKVVTASSFDYIQVTRMDSPKTTQVGDVLMEQNEPGNYVIIDAYYEATRDPIPLKMFVNKCSDPLKITRESIVYSVEHDVRDFFDGELTGVRDFVVPVHDMAITSRLP